MTGEAISGHTLAATRLCRIPNCPNEALASSPRRGPWANLCEEHRAVEGARRRSVQKAPSARAANGSGPAAEEGFERKARGLVAVGRRLDSAIRKYRPAKAELDAAMDAWSGLCRALAGEERQP